MRSPFGRRPATVAEPLLRGLPDEIVVWEILVRLPPKSLLRCRAVSPAWRRATTNHDFLLAHHDSQPASPLVSTYLLEPLSIDIIPVDHRDADQLHSLARLDYALFEPAASCDGLLILSDCLKRFYVCNPVTRQFAPLKQLHGFTILGMYPHSPTGEYRLLLYLDSTLMGGELPPGLRDGCHVFTLGSFQPPRNIGTGWPEDVSTATVPVLFRGSLHWHLEQQQPETGSDMIHVFDTTTELFRRMASPVHGGADMFEMDGRLGVYTFNQAATMVDIWVLQDYESAVWAFKCRVELPAEEIRVQFGECCKYRDVVVTPWDYDVRVLLQSDDWLLQIDMDGKVVASFHREGLCLTHLRLKQTLVPHTFFPVLEGYVVNDLPFV